ncbi:hypothetical protein [Kaarinaea lacus]
MNIRNFGHSTIGQKSFMALCVSTFLYASGISTALAYDINENSTTATPAERATYRDQAKRIHDRLVGVPPTAEALTVMANLIDPTVDGDQANGAEGGIAGAKLAATYAMTPDANPANGNPRAWLFYTVSLKNWITPWTNAEQTMFAPLNDYTTTVIGMILNDDPFNEVLSASYIYTGDVSAINSNYGISLPGYSRVNNNHYEQMESNNVDLSQYLVKTQQSTLGIAGSSLGDSAGVVTTRAAGEAFFKAGTNRRMFRFTLMNYMCRDLEDVKDITRIPDRIRQDVSRSPGGDSTLFLNSCIGCHSGMDPLASAYAYYEWTEDDNGDNGQVVYSNGLFVQPKHHINSTNFEYGYIIRDHSWNNYWREGPNAALEWDWGTLPTTGAGNGARELGMEIANTHAFAQCQVEKVYKQVCLQDPVGDGNSVTTGGHEAELATITTNFRNGGYILKQVFADVATLCMGN